MSAYQIEYRLFVHYGQRWEHETTELTLADIRKRMAEYRENCPQYPVKWTRARVLTDTARDDAKDILRACGVAVGADFCTLRSETVDALLEHADRAKYRKPRNANGSRGRYFHDMLQRRASRAD